MLRVDCLSTRVVATGTLRTCFVMLHPQADTTAALLLLQRTNTKSRVVTAMTLLKHMLFRYSFMHELLKCAATVMILTLLPSLPLHSLSYQGHVSAALVLGGVDVTGPHLYTVWPHGRFVHSWFSAAPLT